MRKELREREGACNDHALNMFFPHLVVLLKLACMTFVPIRDGRAVVQSHLDCRLKQNRKLASSLCLNTQLSNRVGAVAWLTLSRQDDAQLGTARKHLRSINQALEVSFVNREVLAICPKLSGWAKSGVL